MEAALESVESVEVEAALQSVVCRVEAALAAALESVESVEAATVLTETGLTNPNSRSACQ